MINIIVAISENNAIGKDGDLLCHMSADLKHFKELTTGHTVIMGRKTYLSLPRRPLPNRRNIVLTRNNDWESEGAETIGSLEAVKALAEQEELFIIGGGSVYEQMMPYADKMYVTLIHQSWTDADTYFPPIDNNLWKIQGRQDFTADEKNPYDYSFIEYIKIK